MPIDKGSADRGCRVASVLLALVLAAVPLPASADSDPADRTVELDGETAIAWLAFDRHDGSTRILAHGQSAWIVDLDAGDPPTRFDGFRHIRGVTDQGLLVGLADDGRLRLEALDPASRSRATALETWWPSRSAADEAIGRIAVWRTEDGAIYALDLATGTTTEVFAPASVVIGRRRIELPSGTRLVTEAGALVAHSSDGRREVLRPDTASLPDVFAASGDAFAAVLGPSARDSEIELWDVSTRELRLRFDHEGALVQSLALSQNGDVLAVAHTAGIDVWSAESGERVVALRDHDDTPNAVALLPDRTVISGHVEGSLRVVLPDGTPAMTTQIPDRLCPRRCPVERLFVSAAGDQVVAITRARTAAVYAVERTPSGTPELSLAFDFRLDPVAVAVSPDGTRVHVGSDDGAVVTFDTARRRVVSEIPARYGPVARLFPSPDGRYLVLGHRTGAYSLWQVDGAFEVAPIGSERPFPDQAIAFSPDGRALAYARDNGDVEFVDPSTGLPLGRLEAGRLDRRALDIRWTADGARVLVLTRGRLMVAEVDQRVAVIYEAPQLGPSADAAALTDDGTLLAVASGGRVVLHALSPPVPQTSSSCACSLLGERSSVPVSSAALMLLAVFVAVWNRRRLPMRCPVARRDNPAMAPDPSLARPFAAVSRARTVPEAHR